MTSEKLLVEKHGRVTLIRLNDPATLNALSMELADDLSAALRAAQSTSRAIVLAGSQRSFCSGANLGGAVVEQLGTVDAGEGLTVAVNPLMMVLRDLEVPFVTAIRGAAAGVGASIALAGDLIIAGPGAYFLQAFTRIGLVPDGGSAWLLGRTVGRVRAMELMLLGEKLPAAKAFEWGLVTRLVPDAEVESTALDLATRLASGPTMALSLMRRSAWAALESSFEDQLRLESQLQTTAGFHPDFKEGVTAFHQKRPPRFGDQ